MAIFQINNPILISKTLAADTPPAPVEKLNNIHIPIGDQVNKTDLNLLSVVDTVQSITQIALDVVGFLAAAYFLYGAFLYIISYGEDSKAAKAKQTMTWSIYGLAVVIIAQILISIIIDQFK